MDKINRKAQELDDFAEIIRGKVDDLANKSDLDVGYVIVMTCPISSNRWARETITNIAPDRAIELLTTTIKVVSQAENLIKTPDAPLH